MSQNQTTGQIWLKSNDKFSTFVSKQAKLPKIRQNFQGQGQGQTYITLQPSPKHA